MNELTATPEQLQALVAYVRMQVQQYAWVSDDAQQAVEAISGPCFRLDDFLGTVSIDTNGKDI